MKILCDEHVSPAVANALEGEGFEVATVASALSTGTTDDDVLEYAANEGYVVLTNDSDFVDGDGHRGVLYFEDQSVSNRELVRAIRQIDDLLPTETLVDRTVFLPDGWV